MRAQLPTSYKHCGRSTERGEREPGCKFEDIKQSNNTTRGHLPNQDRLGVAKSRSDRG